MEHMEQKSPKNNMYNSKRKKTNNDQDKPIISKTGLILHRLFLTIINKL